MKNKYFFEINGTFFSDENPLIIAELGTSHNGDIKKAKKMIDAAADSGAVCAKFQLVYADEILHPNTGVVPLPGGNIRLYDRFKTLEAPQEFYIDIKEYTESKGLIFLCTPFGMKSAEILKGMKPAAVKIASPELNYTGLLKEVAAWEIPALLSSGVSKLADIEAAISIMRNEELGIKNICLLHCVTSYPAPEIEYNLRLLPNLSAIFGVSVGVSDHSSDPVLVPALAVSMGACVIEKHFCLSKNDPGLDDPIALAPDDFLKMTKAVKQAAKDRPQETIARLSKEKGFDLIEQILGNGIKKLSASEEANYRRTNRSIHALREIKKGEKISKNDFAVLRTEKILRPGLEPFWEDSIEGRTAKNDIPSGEGIRFEDI